ncbi:MAG: TetR/AcrR family transcriptional regulator [Clostridia bacterium]|nr:TetR/AcrR family transcriptional regulator [Clostridia bacterium]
MEEEFTGETLKNRLIIAGIEEISTYGISHFSLRRVAARCDASCAAPYRHFKNREEFIREIIAYIHSRWHLLSDKITSLYASDTRRMLVELCVAYIRFLTANANYRAALSASGEQGGESSFLAAPIDTFCREAGADRARAERLFYSLHALIYGTVSMLSYGELKNDEASFKLIRETVGSLLD